MTSDGTASMQRARFLQELLAIREDPQVKRLARARAGDPDLAEDALQEAFCAVARVEHPEQIASLRSYFCTVMIRTVHRLRGELQGERRPAGQPAPPGKDQDAAAAPGPGAEESLAAGQLAGEWRERFSAHRDRLRAAVPGRSPDPARYRNVILAVAERLLGTMPDLDDEAGSSGALRAAYPEWFTDGGCTADRQLMRLAWARSDVRNLLLAAVQPGAGSHPGASRLPAASRGDTRPPDQLAAQRDKRAQAADDAVISALFRQAEQAQSAHEAPYDLERELELFTTWLDGGQ